jgi:hypothetical protein
LPAVDGYMLKSILHTFNDADCLIILDNINKACYKGSRVLIIEPLIGERNKPGFGILFNLQLRVGVEGGRE